MASVSGFFLRIKKTVASTVLAISSLQATVSSLTSIVYHTYPKSILSSIDSVVSWSNPR